MALPDFTMRQLLEAGVHFGHQTHRWNPKMAPYIYGARNNIHVIDLSQTVPLLHQALKQVSDVVARGGRVLFVGTKRQASDIVADAAKRSAQYYVNARWLGGMLTNWKTISNSIQRLRKVDEILANQGESGFTKKELLNLQREREKLDKALGGIKDMGHAGPDVRDRYQQGSDRHPGGQASRHSGRRRDRFQLRSGQGRFPDPGQ
jgi:small subunit ribosomal protein S2